MEDSTTPCNASDVTFTHHVLESGLELTCVERPCMMTNSEDMSHENLIGLGIAIGANAVIPLALNLQKLAHNQNTDADGNPRQPMTELPLWWIGLLLMISGEFFNLLAYGFAPTSLVAPVGAVGVFFNGIIATLGMKEPFGLRDALGLVAIAGGVVLVVLAVPEVQMDLNKEMLWNNVLPDWRVRGYGIFVVSFSAFWMVVVVPRYKERFVLCYLMLCAVIASVTVVCSRAFSSILTEALASGHFSEFVSPIPYVAAILIGVTAVGSTFFLNKAMMHFGNNEVVPVYYCTFTLASVSAGALVYSEFYCLTLEHTILFGCGCAVTFLGVFCVAWGKEKGAASKDKTGTTFRRMVDDSLPAAAASAADSTRSAQPSCDSSGCRTREGSLVPAAGMPAVRENGVVAPGRLDRAGSGSWTGGLASDIEVAVHVSTTGGSTLVGSINKAATAQILHSVLSGSSRSRSSSAQEGAAGAAGRSRSSSRSSCKPSPEADSAASSQQASQQASAANSVANSISEAPTSSEAEIRSPDGERRSPARETEMAEVPRRTAAADGATLASGGSAAGALSRNGESAEFSHRPGEGGGAAGAAGQEGGTAPQA